MQLIVFFQPLLQRQVNCKLGLQLSLQCRHIPLLLNAARGNIAVDSGSHDILADGDDRVGNIRLRQQVFALLVNNLALVVRHVIEFQQLLADIKVTALHLALGLFYGIGHHTVFNSLAFVHAQCLHETFNPLRRKYPHQIIFHGQVKPGHTRVALSTRATAQLIIDATGLMPLRA